MTPLKEFINKYGCEEVGGRLIAVVGGKKEYVAEILDGGYSLTLYGQKMVESTAPAIEDKPKRKSKKDAVADDLFAGVEENV